MIYIYTCTFSRQQSWKRKCWNSFVLPMVNCHPPIPQCNVENYQYLQQLVKVFQHWLVRKRDEKMKVMVSFTLKKTPQVGKKIIHAFISLRWFSVPKYYFQECSKQPLNDTGCTNPLCVDPAVCFQTSEKTHKYIIELPEQYALSDVTFQKFHFSKCNRHDIRNLKIWF